MSIRPLICALALLTTFTTAAAARAAEPAPGALDPSLKPDDADEISNVYRDMGIVQRQAMKKGGKFLFSTYGTFDFSDGPYTNYSLSLNPGYAISDFFEVYLNVAPVFFVSARPIVATVQQLQLQDGSTATLVSAIPKMQIGGEILWAPLYGKDSLGISRVVRSDTFFKLGVSQVTYDSGSGLRFVAGIGKTFFLGKWLGARVTVDYGQLQNIINGVKAFRSMALVETGFNIYL